MVESGRHLVLIHLSPRFVTFLDPSKSKGRRKVVWLAQPDKRDWLRQHLETHHGRSMRYEYIVQVSAKFRKLNLRKQREGIWLSRVPIDYISVHGLLPIDYSVTDQY